jgi:hypothetical protein
MPEMSAYCKAYAVRRLRDFSGWTEKVENLRARAREASAGESESRRVLSDDDYLFVHDSYVVTDSVFCDRNIVFEAVTPEWKQYCRAELKFEPPASEARSAVESGNGRQS